MLIGLFLNFNDLRKGILFSGLLFLINIAVFSVITISNRREIKIHFIVGKSRKKELSDSLIVNAVSHFMGIILFEILSKLIFNSFVLVELSLFSIGLIMMKTIILYILLREII
jgi:hypothetical protein